MNTWSGVSAGNSGMVLISSRGICRVRDMAGLDWNHAAQQQAGGKAA
jgi:hypothetical protein